MKFIIDSDTILDLINNHVSSVIEVKPDVLVSTMFLENGDVEITLTPAEDNSAPAKAEPKQVAKKPVAAPVTKEAKKEEPAEVVTEEAEEVKEEEPKKPSPFANKGALGNNPLFKDSSEDEVVAEEEPPFKAEEEEKKDSKKPFSFAKLGQPKND